MITVTKPEGRHTRVCETENCQSVQSFLATFPEFAESSSVAFTEFAEWGFWYSPFLLKNFGIATSKCRCCFIFNIMNDILLTLAEITCT